MIEPSTTAVTVISDNIWFAFTSASDWVTNGAGAPIGITVTCYAYVYSVRSNENKIEKHNIV